MFANLGMKIDLGTMLKPAAYYLQRPYRLFREYDRANLRPDLVAGMTVAVIALPQVIAFALIAQLPPQTGIYTIIVGAFVGALWGISNHAHYGPANAISLLVAAALTNIYTPGTAEFMLAAGVMAVMVGVFQLLLGLLRLGVLINFVSHSVVVGFTAGAGLLILIKQIGSLLGVSLDTTNPFIVLRSLIANLPHIHWTTVILGLGSMALILVLRRFWPKAPGSLLAIVAATTVSFVLRLDEAGVAMIGSLSRTLPPLAKLPLLDWTLLQRLSSGALAVGSISLIQSSAIVRSFASQSGQRIDSNQEFVGQGMANIAAGFFSGYASAASFSRSAVNFKAGAKTPMAAIFSSIILLAIALLLAPLAAYLPLTALSAVIIIIAYGLIDQAEISRIWRGAPGDAAIMIVTLLATLFLDIQFAVLVGISLSLVLYIIRTSLPSVQAVLPDGRFRHFTYQSDEPLCPQLGIIDILGDLYFGAVSHVEEMILSQAEQNPDQRFLLIRMHRVNHCDFSGIHMLENIARIYREKGGDLFLVRVNSLVLQLMKSTGFYTFLGSDHFLNEDEAVSYLFHRILDPAVCIYECPLRVFKECQNLPKQIDLAGIPREYDIPVGSVFTIPPREVWQKMVDGASSMTAVPPVIIDVREPREFKRGHIPGSRSVPLSRIISDTVKLSNDQQIVLACRIGRRSRRAAYALQQRGITNVIILEGGLLGWEAAGLLEAVGNEQ